MAGCSSTARSAHVADAGTLGSNSALTGLTSVSGNFLLENGATVSDDRQFEHHRQRHGGARRAQHRRRRGHQPDDRRDADQQQHQRQRRSAIGNTGITSADTLTVNGTGGLSNTGDINIEGSASATAKLVVTNTATSSGTIIDRRLRRSDRG